MEMASWKIVGDLLLESGWTLALNDAGIASEIVLARISFDQNTARSPGDGAVASQTTARSLEELGIPTGRRE